VSRADGKRRTRQDAGREYRIAGWPKDDLIAEWNRDTVRLAETTQGYRRTCGTGWPG
jgi:hypothetical protein